MLQVLTHGREAGGARSQTSMRRALAFYGAFYSRPRGRSAGLVTAGFLTYGGGIVMFWLHAVQRGENGPPISHPAHWLLDSTLAFAGLLPVVLALVPVAVLAASGADRGAGWLAPRRGVYAAITGVAFAIATAPGPLLHNVVAGAGTPVAEAATAVAGTDRSVAAAHAHSVHHSPVEEGLLQVLVGLPVYMASAWIAAATIDRCSARRRRRERRLAFMDPASYSGITAVPSKHQPQRGRQPVHMT